MTGYDENLKQLLNSLNERAKELNCLYRVDETLRNEKQSLAETMNKLVKIIPDGWQHCDICQVKVSLNGDRFQTTDFHDSQWSQIAPILVNQKKVGEIQISYSRDTGHVNPFLKEEEKLLHTIADKISDYLHRQELKQTIDEWRMVRASIASSERTDWKVIIDLLLRTDTEAYLRIARKMMNYLYWIGSDEAISQLETLELQEMENQTELQLFANKPMNRQDKKFILERNHKVFDIAENFLSGEEILDNLQKWIQEDRISFFVLALEDLATSLSDIQNALARYYSLGLDKIELTQYTRKNINVLLILRFFTDQLEFINIAKDFIRVDAFQSLIQHMIFPNNSHGKLGGKSAGIFLAHSILEKEIGDSLQNIDIRYPKTWYITSDTMHRFLYYNNLKEIIEQKYKDIEQVREEYGNVIQMFKNSHFPPEIVKDLSRALDDFGDHPIIVRSSSLLEDRVGAAFSGKYKSLFLANQGSKPERLNALMDAISEVYASTFGPDPIVYRKERGLLDFHEEMAIIIQEVVGARIGKYFLPAFAGVAFSNNEFRWSPRISREDGLIRIVPGLGTRAVDRLSDDFPILIAPGRPNLRVNVSDDEILRYAPRKIDLINLEKNTFETVEASDLIRQYGEEYPMIEQVVSINQKPSIVTKNRFSIDFENDDAVVTFHGLTAGTPEKGNYVLLIKEILQILKEKMGVPVDIEFACDGKALYLLQCRSQSADETQVAASIPKDVPEKDILFTARKYISNGYIPEVTHIVYVDPDRYSSLNSLEELKTIGKVVGRLNAILPKRKFILMGPGRWGSRGDIKLGVSVTYADINNASVLIEIARKKGQYTPDLSFGTHFFQDLVESSIRYLPLYPDDPDILFNAGFLNGSENILSKLLPEFDSLSETIKVIDVTSSRQGKVLQILMNADLDEALARFTDPGSIDGQATVSDDNRSVQQENHWLWRYRMAERIARLLDAERFGVKHLYIFGSVKNASAGPASDIDLLIHAEDDPTRIRSLITWLEGWSLSLAEFNYLKTGYRTDGLLDVHIITDKDIENRTSFAVKIGAVTDAARILKMKGQ